MNGFSLSGLGFALALSCAGCKHPAPGVKIYSSQPPIGLVRKQTGEVVPYADSKDYLCMKPADFETLLNWCSGPKDNAWAQPYVKSVVENGL
jgi:hypothetical protein